MKVNKAKEKTKLMNKFISISKMSQNKIFHKSQIIKDTIHNLKKQIKINRKNCLEIRVVKVLQIAMPLLLNIVCTNQI